MKKIRPGLSIIPIQVLAVIIPTLVAAIILIFSSYSYSSINIADAHSFLQSSSFLSSLQPQQTLQQKESSVINGIDITRNPTVQQFIHQPFPSSLQSTSFVKWSLSQQQQNQEPNLQQQDPLNTIGFNNTNKADNHVSRPKPLLPFLTQVPEPTCYFTLNPLFCPHFLWTLK